VRYGTRELTWFSYARPPKTGGPTFRAEPLFVGSRGYKVDIADIGRKIHYCHLQRYRSTPSSGQLDLHLALGLNDTKAQSIRVVNKGVVDDFGIES
jgi:hypothetical protein